MKSEVSDLKIKRITDSETISRCAVLMSANDPWTKLKMDYDICLKAFEGDHRETYAAFWGNELAGFIILQVTGTFSGYIQSVCIEEKFRGSGIGTELIDFSEKRILEFSPNIFICVSEFNTRAAKLYYSLGYKLVGRLDSFLKEGFTELLLRKSFGPRLDYVPPTNR
jgi:ribosomal protein S18 acetylase RimI-like enzyme